MTFHKWARPAMMLTAKIRGCGTTLMRFSIQYEHPYANDDAIADERKRFVNHVLSKVGPCTQFVNYHLLKLTSSVYICTASFYLGGKKMSDEQVKSLAEKGRI